MAGQKFQYDESGTTFFYFLLSFLALILIPATFYYWPKKRKEDPEKLSQECQCPECVRKKRVMSEAQPYKGAKQLCTKLALISGWLLLIFLAYKVSQFEYEMAKFDPYEILGVPLGSSQSEIKKAYRKQSVVLHPDKETGDEKAFMKLTKAYQALTDAEARKNWEKYGNPDGPGAMSFGIALPSWIVEKENSVWVLGLYALVFMIALPVAVGTWWYRSIRFSGDQVLLDTTQMYYYFFYKTPSMPLKRALMILAASLEFDKRHNSEVVERLSDNEEVPALIKQLPNLNEKSKEMPLCRLYSIKARAIIHAHLSRMKLNPNTLEKDRQLIVKKCPYLIQEMVSCVNQLIVLAYARRIQRLLSIETVENCMKLSPMIIQGLWQFKSPLLQLPYVTEDSLKYFTAKKRHIKTLQQFAQMPGDERRAVLKSLTDFEYDNVMKVLGQMPFVDFQVQCEVIDDENPTVVTAGAIVTVTVTLTRRDMRELFGDESVAENQDMRDEDVENTGDPNTAEADKEKDASVKKPAWLKQTNKKASSNKKNKNKFNKAKPVTKVVDGVVANNVTNSKDVSKPNETPKVEKKPPTTTSKESVTDSDSEGSDCEKDDRTSEDEKKSSSIEDDDTEWDKFQQRLQKRDKVLEGRSKTSHSVHCPLFPEDKQEYWWTYICDRKSKTLLTAPYHVTALVEREEVQLKFTAPRWPGVYALYVCLRSDSYLGMDQQLEMRLDVQEAPEVPTEHPQWDLSESEDEQNVRNNESDFTTDDEAEDDD